MVSFFKLLESELATELVFRYHHPLDQWSLFYSYYIHRNFQNKCNKAEEVSIQIIYYDLPYLPLLLMSLICGANLCMGQAVHDDIFGQERTRLAAECL